MDKDTFKSAWAIAVLIRYCSQLLQDMIGLLRSSLQTADFTKSSMPLKQSAEER